MPFATTSRRLACALSAAFLLFVLAGSAHAQWINELHYDNTGADEGEAVEVVLPSAADPADFELYLYNGSNGMVYGGPYDLGTFAVGDTEGGFTVYSLEIAPIQNGAPDGLALVEGGVLVEGQFLSYEGTFEGVGGPADGVTSTDIGVEEGSGTPVGHSLQLTGTGSQYADFTWAEPSASSFGSVNGGQALEPASATPVVAFTATGGNVVEGEEATLTVTIDYLDDAPDGNPVTVTVLFDEAASTADEADFSGPTPPQVTFDGTTDNETMSVTVSTTAGDGPEGNETAVFELFVAGGIAELGTPSAFTLLIEDGEAPDPARVQVIHNAPDPLADVVDIAIVDVGEGGDGTVFDDVSFREATPFFDLAPGTYDVIVTDDEDLGIVLINETVTVVSGGTYQIVASGVGEGGFEPNPDGREIAFTLLVNADARVASMTPDNMELNFVHGSPDAPTIDVRTGVTQDIILFNDVTYGDITGYQATASGSDFEVEVTTADGTESISLFLLGLGGREDEAGTILASGFLTPDNEPGDAPSFGLLVVFADGSAEFALPISLPSTEDGATASAFALDGNYPNPFAGRTTLRYDLAVDALVDVEVFDALGRRVLVVEPQAVTAGTGRTVELNAALPSGAYLYRLTAEMPTETRVETGRMTVVR